MAKSSKSHMLKKSSSILAKNTRISHVSSKIKPQKLKKLQSESIGKGISKWSSAENSATLNKLFTSAFSPITISSKYSKALKKKKSVKFYATYKTTSKPNCTTEHVDQIEETQIKQVQTNVVGEETKSITPHKSIKKASSDSEIIPAITFFSSISSVVFGAIKFVSIMLTSRKKLISRMNNEELKHYTKKTIHQPTFRKLERAKQLEEEARQQKVAQDNNRKKIEALNQKLIQKPKGSVDAETVFSNFAIAQTPHNTESKQKKMNAQKKPELELKPELETQQKMKIQNPKLQLDKTEKKFIKKPVPIPAPKPILNVKLSKFANITSPNQVNPPAPALPAVPIPPVKQVAAVISTPQQNASTPVPGPPIHVFEQDDAYIQQTFPTTPVELDVPPPPVQAPHQDVPLQAAQQLAPTPVPLPPVEQVVAISPIESFYQDDVDTNSSINNMHSILDEFDRELARIRSISSSFSSSDYMSSIPESPNTETLSNIPSTQNESVLNSQDYEIERPIFTAPPSPPPAAPKKYKILQSDFDIEFGIPSQSNIQPAKSSSSLIGTFDDLIAQLEVDVQRAKNSIDQSARNATLDINDKFKNSSNIKEFPKY
jgi:hypothetical protein